MLAPLFVLTLSFFKHFLDVYRDATDLYGMIHARFAVSQRGLMMLREKYQRGDFDTCPRVGCESQPCLPVGMSEELRNSTMKVLSFYHSFKILTSVILSTL
jgi:hypothetical protein